MKKIALLITFLFISALSLSKGKNNWNQRPIDELIEIMQGTYTSEKQAKIDTSNFNMSLRMIPVWKEKGHTVC